MGISPIMNWHVWNREWAWNGRQFKGWLRPGNDITDEWNLWYNKVLNLKRGYDDDPGNAICDEMERLYSKYGPLSLGKDRGKSPWGEYRRDWWRAAWRATTVVGAPGQHG